METADNIGEIGLEPRLRGRAAAALIGQAPRVGNRLRDEGGCFLELRDIRAGLRHGERDAMRGEDKAGGCAVRLRDSIHGRAEAVGHGFDEAGVIVKGTQLVNLRRAGAYFGARRDRYPRDTGGIRNRNRRRR